MLSPINPRYIKLLIYYTPPATIITPLCRRTQKSSETISEVNLYRCFLSEMDISCWIMFHLSWKTQIVIFLFWVFSVTRQTPRKCWRQSSWYKLHIFLVWTFAGQCIRSRSVISVWTLWTLSGPGSQAPTLCFRELASHPGKLINTGIKCWECMIKIGRKIPNWTLERSLV